LTEITGSDSQIFCGVLGRCLAAALYSLMMDHIRYETCRSDF
jgi:hypothetical protein